MAATSSYKAVPSILTVAPSGNVKLEILVETPLFFLTAFIVSGNVALLDEVEKAVIKGVRIALKCLTGLTRPIVLNTIGNTINA